MRSKLKLTSYDLRGLLYQHRERYDAVHVFADEVIDGAGLDYPLGGAVARLSYPEAELSLPVRMMRRALALRRAREAKGPQPGLVPFGVVMLIGGSIGDSGSRWVGLRQFMLDEWRMWGGDDDTSNGMVRWMKEALGGGEEA